jgi:hypothetical protein
MDHIDDRALLQAKLATRDLTGLLVPQEEADRKRQAREAAQGQMSQAQLEFLQAQIRNELSQAFKNIAQGQKNQATADAETADSALNILERGLGGHEQDQGAAAGAR